MLLSVVKRNDRAWQWYSSSYYRDKVWLLIVGINVDYINLYSTCKIRGFAFLVPRTGSFVCKWLRPSEERNREQIKEQEKALFNGLPSSSKKNISRISSAFLPRLLILCALPRWLVAVASFGLRCQMYWFEGTSRPSTNNWLFKPKKLLYFFYVKYQIEMQNFI